MKEALRGVLEDMAQQEEAIQADAEQKGVVILAQQWQIAVLEAAVQVASCLSSAKCAEKEEGCNHCRGAHTPSGNRQTLRHLLLKRHAKFGDLAPC